jgi:DNA-binding SARP family transcriptional activator/tetratricopeptide (TPR) repeat protein
MEFGLLGPVEARWRGEPLAIGPRKQRFVLAVLALEVNRLVPVDRLVELTWPVAPPRQAEHAVRVCVSGLRAALAGAGPAVEITTGGSGYALRAEPMTVDAHRFRSLVEQARATDDDPGRVALLDEALRLWRGPALAGTVPAESRDQLCHALDEARLLAVEDRVDARLRLGQQRAVLDELTGLARAHPARERLVGQLMLALYRDGRAGEALAAYRQLRQRLADDLGIDPGAELRQLELAILRHDPALGLAPDAAAGPAGDPRGDRGADPTTTRPASGSTGDRSADPVTAPSVAGGVAGRPPPAQLPADVAGFTGRSGYLRQLDELLPDADRPTAVVVAAIGGTAGVGKTALAVHWAHRVRDRFPDGQLYVNLNGHAAGPPMRPVDALARFLRALGVPADQVPVEVTEAAGLYRSALARARTLVVLDNAASADQVRPLLPGGPGCLVLVTSRDRLSGLAARDGAHRLALDVLAQQEAVALLAAIAGTARVDAEPAAAAELARGCGHLPLAVRIVGAHLTDHPDRSLAEQASQLTDGDRLAALAVDGDPETAVRAAFDLSYATLPAAARRLFRLLGLVPGPDATPPAAAALAGTSVATAAGLLDRLAAASLLGQPTPGRYAPHDLLRAYALDRAAAQDGAPACAAARGRLLDWYLATADAAARLLYPDLVRLDLPLAAAEPPPAGLADHTAATGWLAGELPNLLGAITHAAEHGPRPAAWLLADTLRGYFHLSQQAVEWLRAGDTGLAAAVAEADLPAQAAMHLSVALAHFSLNRYPTALEHYTAAADLARRAGWLEGQAAVLGNIGNVHADMGDLRQAAEWHRQALELHKQTGRRANQAATTSNLGFMYRQMGELRRATDHHVQALALYQQTGSRAGEALALANLGRAEHDRGQLDQAHTHLVGALELHRRMGNRYGEVGTLNDLAGVLLDSGRPAEALETVQNALDLARDNADRSTEARVLTVLGAVELRLGRPEPAADHQQLALRLARQARAPYPETCALIGLAAAHRDQRQHDIAARYAARAITLARQVGYRVLEGTALATLASIQLAAGDREQAADHAKQALALHQETGHTLGAATAQAVLDDIDAARATSRS